MNRGAVIERPGLAPPPAIVALVDNLTLQDVKLQCHTYCCRGYTESFWDCIHSPVAKSLVLGRVYRGSHVRPRTPPEPSAPFGLLSAWQPAGRQFGPRPCGRSFCLFCFFCELSFAFEKLLAYSMWGAPPEVTGGGATHPSSCTWRGCTCDSCVCKQTLSCTALKHNMAPKGPTCTGVTLQVRHQSAIHLDPLSPVPRPPG